MNLQRKEEGTVSDLCASLCVSDVSRGLVYVCLCVSNVYTKCGIHVCVCLCVSGMYLSVDECMCLIFANIQVCV